MKPIVALIWLTLKAALRYRLFVALAGLMFAAVVVLPLVIRDDGTAQGFTQILLTYTLTAITSLLGFSTLWLSCGTLARDIEECQMQMVAVKPVARWQIWLGKWLGIMLINLALLVLAGSCVYFLLYTKASRLKPDQQTVLFNEVLVARGSMRPEPPNVEPYVEQFFQQRLKEVSVAPADRDQLRRQIREQVLSRFQLIPSGYSRPWKIDLSPIRDRIQDQPLHLRVRFAAAGLDMSVLATARSFKTLWQVGDPESNRIWRSEKSLAAEAFHVFQVPANLVDAKGVLTIECINPNPEALLFQVEDGMEVLYREGGFALNFFRGLGIILCWLSLLTAIGLAAASFLSFPVAAFFSITVLLIGLSTSTMSQVVEEGGVFGVNHETGKVESPGLINQISLPFFRGMLTVVKLVEDFSPIDSLSTGRSITWAHLGRALGQITVFMGGLFAAFGMFAFTRRELAAVQAQ